MKDKVGLLFDGDILLYRAGFAAEKRVYLGTPGSRVPPAMRWTSAKSAKEDCEKWGLDYKTSVTWIRQPEPVDNAIHNLNTLIKTITTDFSEGKVTSALSKDPEVKTFIFLTGCGIKPNFREALDPAYKANRDPKNKPVHMEELKAYMIAHYPTIVTQGCEADDYLSQAQSDMTRMYPDMTPVIVTLDKDLDQIYGYKYNFVDKTLNYVTATDGDIFFLKQMILGDKADNIEGIKGYGPAKMEKLFYHCVTVDDYVRKAHQAYVGAYGSVASAREQWNKNCDLLWIWRKVPDECPFKIHIVV